MTIIITHLLSFSLDELSTKKCDNTAIMSSAIFFLLCLCPKTAPLREPALLASRSKCPVDAEID